MMTTQPPQTRSVVPPLSDRLVKLPPYGFAVIGQRIADLVATGKDVIRLDIGSPDMPPPSHVIEALNESAANPKHHSYGSYRGLPAFRKAVADYYQRRFGADLDPAHEVLPLIGSKEGIINLALAFIDQGDVVIAPDLNYPAYTMGTLMAGGSVILMPLDPKRNYWPDLSRLTTHPDFGRAKMLWVNYPNNPTGAVAELALYEELVAFCREHHILLCSDNPYAEVVFDGYQSPSVFQVPDAKDVAVEFMSLSKMYNMAGWRLGACVGNREAVEALLVVKSNMDSGHFRPVYDAGIAALDHTTQVWMDARNAIYQARRDRILAVCPDIGLEAYKTPGSLYVWARVKDGDDDQYVDALLESASVAVTPGRMYGPAGRGYIRLSLGVEDKRLDEALNRMRGWYRGL